MQGDPNRERAFFASALTIADPIINTCVRRNYDIVRFEKYKSLENRENIPLLMIP